MPSPRVDDPAQAEGHGSPSLAAVTVDSYSLELRDDEGELVGDKASQTAFRQLLERWRKRARKEHGTDPLGSSPSESYSKKKLDRLVEQEPAAAHLVQGASDEFADQLAEVIHEFTVHKAWRGIERIIIGGGFQQSAVGQRAVERAIVVLRSKGTEIDMRTLRHEADDGGLIGWVHLAPRPMVMNGYDALLAVDIGGTNLRVGIVRTHVGKADDLSKADVIERQKWRHADDEPDRKNLIDRLADMLAESIEHAEHKGIALAPFVGVACPGVIREDGSIASGAQNLPGDWESSTFHLPSRLAKKIPTIGGKKTLVRMHNDAVVQGLSELPHVQDVKRWAVLTIGTGLGNATYTNKK
ncbi:MAG: ROK family protein [Comamonadaceae bacterium]|nr:MAG: ROK family protein [Comamonadaceae bacterium]